MKAAGPGAAAITGSVEPVRLRGTRAPSRPGDAGILMEIVG